MAEELQLKEVIFIPIFKHVYDEDHLTKTKNGSLWHSRLTKLGAALPSLLI